MVSRSAKALANSRPRTTGFNALDVLVTDLKHLIEFEVFHRAFLGSEVQHRVLRLGVQDETGGVGLRVATDDEDLLAKLDERGERVLGGGLLADAALPVKCDLA